MFALSCCGETDGLLVEGKVPPAMKLVPVFRLPAELKLFAVLELLA